MAKKIFHGFEFFRYHTTHKVAVGNEYPIIHRKIFCEDKTYYLNKYFQENGYIIRIANGTYSKETSPPKWGKKNGEAKYIAMVIIDHELYVLFFYVPFNGIRW